MLIPEKIRLIGTCLAMAWTLSCGVAVAKSPSLEELDAQRATNLKASTREFKSKTAADIRQAAFEVLKLVDPNDMTFDPRPDRLLAARHYAFLFPLASVIGKDYYEVVYKDTEDGVSVTVKVTTIASAGMLPSGTSGPDFLADITVGTDKAYAVNPMIFFDRLEYFLGLKPDWMTCATFKEIHRVKGKKYVTPGYFCGGMGGRIGVADKVPTTIKGSAP